MNSLCLIGKIRKNGNSVKTDGDTLNMHLFY